MPSLIFAVTISFSILLAMTTFAFETCEEFVPDSNTSDWYFAKVILGLNEQAKQKAERLKSACKNFDSSNDFSVWLNGLDTWHFRGSLFYLIYAEIPDAFRNLSHTEEEINYANQLTEIKKIPSAVERIKETYSLVIRHQKPYNYKLTPSSNREIIYTPERTLKYGGVCRDFARTLKWSLQQVAKSSSTDRNAETFTPEIQWGHDGKDKGHMWVSVNVPIRNTNGHIQRFAHIDLDSTNYNLSFVPLMPLSKNLSHQQMKQNFKSCQQIISCLEQN
ncbi:MAG: hypothetical protein A4S09_03290 [Proteobacteria bacterium SG_bin7]|nr:MAG: hypothetical protein A4S09_03290 [Proteobacteria bacterium SG_bin7]